MNYDNYLNQECVFIEYETQHAKGRMVILLPYYNKINKKLMTKLRNCTLTLFEQRKFTYQDIDFVKKGCMKDAY